MGPISAAFLLILAACVTATRAARGAGGRALALSSCGAALVLAAAPSASAAVPFPAMLLAGWLWLRAQSRLPGPAALWAGVLTVVGVFMLVRGAGPALDSVAAGGAGGAIGLSYVMFRLLHLLVDAHGGEAPRRMPVATYLAYLLFPPCFLAGPIHRFQDFAKDLADPSPPRWGAEALAHLGPLLTGTFGLTVSAGLAHFVFGRAEAALLAGGESVLLLALWVFAAVVSFAGWLYLGFAGYSDMARGTAGLMGVRLPANFDAPWRAENFLAIWPRWHVSLSDWFRIYLFNPVLRLLLTATDRPDLAPWLGAAAYLATFLVMGVWHGVTWRFLAYGLALGLAAGGNRVFQAVAARRLGKAGYARLKRDRTYAAASRAAGLGTFLLALGFLWVPAGAFTGRASAWAVAAAGVFGAVFLLALAGPRLAVSLPRPSGRIAAALRLLALLAWLLATGGSVPPLIYQYF